MREIAELKKRLKNFSDEYDIQEGPEKTLLLIKNKETISTFSVYFNTNIQEIQDWINKNIGVYIEPKEAVYILIKDIEDIELLKDCFNYEDYIFVNKLFDAYDMWCNVCDNTEDQETQDFIHWIKKNYSLPDYVFFSNCDSERVAEELRKVLQEDFCDSKYIFKFIKKEV